METMTTTKIVKDIIEPISATLSISFNTTQEQGQPLESIYAYVYNAGTRIASAFFNRNKDIKIFIESPVSLTFSEWITVNTRIMEKFDNLLNEE